MWEDDTQDLEFDRMYDFFFGDLKHKHKPRFNDILNDSDYAPYEAYILDVHPEKFADVDEHGNVIRVHRNSFAIPDFLEHIVSDMYVGEHPDGLSFGMVFVAKSNAGDLAYFDSYVETWEMM